MHTYNPFKVKGYQEGGGILPPLPYAVPLPPLPFAQHAFKDLDLDDTDEEDDSGEDDEDEDEEREENDDDGHDVSNDLGLESRLQSMMLIDEAHAAHPAPFLDEVAGDPSPRHGAFLRLANSYQDDFWVALSQALVLTTVEDAKHDTVLSKAHNPTFLPRITYIITFGKELRKLKNRGREEDGVRVQTLQTRLDNMILTVVNDVDAQADST